MKPTMVEGDLILVNKLAYDLKVPFTTTLLAQWGDPERGDIVVCNSPKDGIRLVKRVIGLPGDKIQLRNEVLFINDVPQKYTAQEVKPYLRDIFEAPNPLVAVEHLEAAPHLVMVLPNRNSLRNFGPYIVPKGNYFIMGDSRDNSSDSRFFGPVARKEIVGEAKFVIVSFDTARYLLPRFHRFAHPLKFDGV
jgi:signal peptidase I